MRVDRHQYRFRIVNGSNARFYNLKLSNGMSFIQIGGDGSYLPAPVTLHGGAHLRPRSGRTS